MKDTWLTHNTDKILLCGLVLIFWGTTLIVAIHLFHHDSGDMQTVAFISFMTGSFSTLLGALVMLLTGRTARADGQTANGLPPDTAPAPSPSDPGPNAQ
jgi:peptidoglycan/LPS O-acetylase OafA/YrhL